MSAAANLLSSLKEKFEAKNVEPFGLCLPISKNDFKPEWTAQLQSLGCKVFSQGYGGEIFFFVREPQAAKFQGSEPSVKVEPIRIGLKRPWTDQEIANLKEWCSQGLKATSIGEKLKRSRVSVEAKILRLGLSMNKSKDSVILESSETDPQKPSSNIQDSIVKEYLSACSLLYPSHKKACALLFRELSRELEV